MQEFVLRKLQDGLSHKSVKDIVVMLKMIMRFGAKHGLFELKPIDIAYPTERIRADIQVLSLDSQKKLMKYLRNNFSFENLGILICLATGLRIGEVCALKWEDMDIKAGVIRVNKTIQRIYMVEEGIKSTELILDSPKTKNSTREIPICKELMTIIRPVKRIVDECCYVITNSTKPIEPRTYRAYFNKLMKRAGLPKMRFHGLRHSFATRCIESKCDYKTVSSLLGHANISTTLNLYVHPNMEQKRKCIDTMIRQLK